MMRWLLFTLIFISHSALRAPHSSAADKPVPTKDAAAKMTVPPGFNVTLFAGEPDIVQPIAFTFDDRGRMWVVECLSYPKWSRDGKGKDRVVVLEDTDGDGKHDKKTVVIDNGVNLSGIEWGFGGVWLCSSPNLLFVPITDDKPGKPVAMLDGWNMTDTKHNVFNSLVWGPDGWLYGCNGIQSKSHVGAPGTPKEKRTYCDACVWKFHPTRKIFEVVATGTTNPWGLDFDEHGEIFITNCVIDHLFHCVPGGRYTRMYGQDPNPYAFDLMPSCVDYKHWAGGHWTESRSDVKTGTLRKDHDDAGGGHAHSGAAIYLGDNFPKEYRNTLFTANIHGSRLNNDGLERTKSGMKGVRRPDFLFANDPWFRGICVKQGPEGALYVSDWCDTGECHNYDVADVTNGRIYRVAYGTPKKFDGDVSKMSNEQLVKLVPSENELLSRKARRVLQERATTQPLDEKGKAALLNVIRDDSEPEQLRAAWALHVSMNMTESIVLRLLSSSRSFVQCWACRLATDTIKITDPVVEKIVDLAANSILNGRVIRALAATIPKLPPAKADRVGFYTFTYTHLQKSDVETAKLVWLFVEPLLERDADEWLQRIALSNSAEFRHYAVRRMLSGPDASFNDRLERLVYFIRTLDDPNRRIPLLQGIRDAVASNVFKDTPFAWRRIYLALKENENAEVQSLIEELGIKFNDAEMKKDLAKKIVDANGKVEARGRAIALLSQAKYPCLEEQLRPLLTDPKLRGAAIRGLASYTHEDTAKAILGVYPALPAEEKSDAILTLAGRPKFALALLDAVEKGTVPKADISAFAARQIVALNNKDVSAKLAAVWGSVKAASANRLEQTKKIKALLSPDYLKAANAEKGKALYTKSCAACHKLFGEGGDVGPELTGSQRANLDYILENVLDPNAVVPFDYKMVQFNLLDGRVVTGLVKKETAAAVTVRTANEQIVIAKEDIEKRTLTNNSVMPEGLLDTLKDEEIRDLIAYLQKK